MGPKNRISFMDGPFFKYREFLIFLNHETCVLDEMTLESLGAIHKGYLIFEPILDLLTYLYPIFRPIFGPFYLSKSIHI